MESRSHCGEIDGPYFCKRCHEKKYVISIDSAMTVKDAATMMDDTDVGCVIITKGNAPLGILTERDFV